MFPKGAFGAGSPLSDSEEELPSNPKSNSPAQTNTEQDILDRNKVEEAIGETKGDGHAVSEKVEETSDETAHEETNDDSHLQEVGQVSLIH